MSAPLLEVEGLAKHYPVKRGLVLPKTVGTVRAVDGVTFSLARGETLALVGESGCGKSTTARLVLRLIEPSAGIVRFEGVDITEMGGAPLRKLRRRMQIVFQDPFASLNPRMTVEQCIGEPLLVNGILQGQALRDRVAQLLTMVGLPGDIGSRYPHAFSGGQRQRIVIARALALDPRLIIADEATSALDVTLRGQILDLLLELQPRLGLSFLFISHDLGVIRYFCNRVAVMHRGRIVEIGPTEQICTAPREAYTQRLLAAVPEATPQRRTLVSV